MQASIGRRQMLSCADDDFLFSIFSSESSLETFKTMDSTRKHLPSKKGDYATDNVNKHSLVGSFFFTQTSLAVERFWPPRATTLLWMSILMISFSSFRAF